MAASPLRRPSGETPDLSARAMDNLRYIRETMESAGSFTAVPGWGGVAMGITALLAALLASWQPDSGAWLRVWLAEAVVGAVIGAVTMWRKAAGSQTSLLDAPGRKFALAYVPPVLVGAALTLALWEMPGGFRLMPAVWMMCYGAGVVTGGAHSVKVVPVMGLCFIATGMIALLAPVWTRDLLLALGFGVLHIAFGWYIARRYGG
jgi:hypothetical protein